MKRVVFLVLLLVALSLPLAGCGDSAEVDLQPNRLGELLTCTQTENDQCVNDQDSFPTDTPELFATVILNNATVGAKATCTLTYLGDTEQELISFDLTVNQVTETMRSYLVFNFTNDQPWPTGDYRVIVTMDTTGSSPASKEFTIQ
jgi:hypothetical protein